MRRWFRTVLHIGLMVAAVLAGGTLPSFAVDFEAPATAPPGTVHQLWLVSTRCASACDLTPEAASSLRYWRCDSNHTWRPATLEDLLATDDPAVTTLIYVHENRVTRSESFARAWHVFHTLSQLAPADKRFRLIAISWPADRIGWRPRPDVQIKAQRSEAHGYYLAWLIDHIQPDVPVAMFGNSYGPRMITAALHYLGGGSICGHTLANRSHPDRQPVRAVLMAAALDAHWLYPGQRHGQALTQVAHMLVMVNPCDESLRWYPLLWGFGGPPALGYVGLQAPWRLGPYQSKLVQWDVSGYTGSTHSWTVYEGDPAMMAQVVPHLFGP